MTFRRSIFQAYCHGHSCKVRLGGEQRPRNASLVTISSRSARINILDETLAQPQGKAGDAAALTPCFLDGVQVGDIPARIEAASGNELLLSFTTPLPMPGSRLCQLTRR